MSSLKDKCLVDYPVPAQFSIWGSNGSDVQPVEDLDLLIDSSILELASDILITEHIEASGISTQLPKNTISCKYAKLSGFAFPFQGNRLIKVSFDQSTKIAYLRYYPAVITYQRTFTRKDAELLVGDRLIYIKSYILHKMASKELSVLKSVNAVLDNATIDLSALSDFSSTMKNKYDTMKPEILLYNTNNG